MRTGRQEPTFERVGEYAYSRGSTAVKMFEQYGRRYYGSQKYEMEILYARTASGDFAAKDIGITKPRQNGKSFAARDYAIWMAFVEGMTVLFSMHNGGTARKMFREVKSFVESREDFRSLVRDICESRGYEGIYLDNGAYIEFQTRSTGVRGGTYRILVIDEAQELTAEQSNALIPTASAAAELSEKNAEPQKIYIGTVPDVTCRGTVFKQMHDRVHDGTSSAWWLEWGVQAQQLSDIDLDDVDLWYECNPAMGRRMSENAVRSERDTMTPDGFARERLGWWPRQSVKAVIKKEDWDACEDKTPAPHGLTVFGIKFLGGRATIGVCSKPNDGLPRVEVVKVGSTENGTSWLKEFVSDRKKSTALVVIDGDDASAFFSELVGSGIPQAMLKIPNTAEFVLACSMFNNAVKEHKVTHFGQPELDESALNSKKRAIGKGWGFADNECDSTLVESCALAYMGAMTTKRNPARKQRIG